MFFSLMPIACNRRIVRCRWQRAALLFRRCVSANCAAVDSACLREQGLPRNQIGQSRATAVRTWHTVKPGAFPPILQAEFAQEHTAQTTEHRMALDRAESAHLKMVHAQLRFALFKGALDRPSGITRFTTFRVIFQRISTSSSPVRCRPRLLCRRAKANRSSGTWPDGWSRSILRRPRVSLKGWTTYRQVLLYARQHRLNLYAEQRSSGQSFALSNG